MFISPYGSLIALMVDAAMSRGNSRRLRSENPRLKISSSLQNMSGCESVYASSIRFEISIRPPSTGHRQSPPVLSILRTALPYSESSSLSPGVPGTYAGGSSVKYSVSSLPVGGSASLEQCMLNQVSKLIQA